MTWTDIDDIVVELDEAYPDVDPVTVRFTELRSRIESLEGFDPEPGQQPNEQILEAIQAGWIEEREEQRRGDAEEDDDEPRYRPNDPFR
ncbi:MAG: Fe-S cluster assembly protein IscX [Phycisphaeraceae bacterium]